MKSTPMLSPLQTIMIRRALRKVDQALGEFHAQGTTIDLDARQYREELVRHLAALGGFRTDREEVDSELGALVDSWLDGLRGQVQRKRDARLHALDRLARLVEPARRQVSDLVADAERRIKGIHDAATYALDVLVDPDTPMTYPPADEWQPGSSVTARLARRGNGDPSVIVEKPWLRMSTWFAVLLASAVDIATFYQVLLLVMPVPGPVVVLAVVGFSGVGLILAHVAGKQASKALRPRNIAASGLLAWIFGGIWLSLGAVAFAVRFLISTSGGSGGTIQFSGGASTPIGSGADLMSQHLYAVFFLVLYIATGAIAAHAGFTRPASAARRHRHAVAQRTRAVRRLARTNKELSRIEMASWSIAETRRRTDEAWQAALLQCESEVTGLKRMARLHLMCVQPVAPLVGSPSALPSGSSTPPEEFPT
jgi:hypothetical protein